MSASLNEEVKVLVIDDNFDAAETLTSLLQALGFEAAFRTDGQSGVFAAMKMVPDVILLDLGMPNMDGYETAQLIRAVPELHQCKIVALTAWGDNETRTKTKAGGFHLHLTKPTSVKSLISALDAVQDG